MKKKYIATITAVFLFLFSSWFCHAQEETDEITIGVLAKDGKLEAVKQWKSTADYLGGHLNRPFIIVPLAFKEVLPAVEEEKVDFFIVNPFLFVTAMVRYNAAPVVTMQAAGNDRFGGVIFTAEANTLIHDLSDLNGKKFGGVARTSLGGWQTAQKEFLDAGIEIFDFVSTLRFFDTHTNVVKAVLDRQVDAGTVRTGTLEAMAEAGAINMKDIRVLAKKQHEGFPFVASTPLYPEWALARAASTSGKLAEAVAFSLKNMAATDQAALDAGCTGWSEPLDYSGVQQLQKELKVGAYEEEH